MSSRFDTTTRSEKAAALANRGGIVKSGDTWLVPSTSSDAVYRVTRDGDQLRCTCPDYERRQQPCKHVQAAAIVAGQADQD